MSNTKVNDVVAGLRSFAKEYYFKDEYLRELFSLQDEMVNLTFNEGHAANSDLRIWDVEKHLEELNERCGYPATDELNVFEKDCREFCNLIKALVSGIKGENKAAQAVNRYKGEMEVLRNVELSDGEHKTEIDEIVITKKGITILEVKNTSRDIFISESGNYYRVGEFTNFDCNIAMKMAFREELIKSTLEKAGIHNIPIQSVLVFTDSRIRIHNKYQELRVCFPCQVSSIIFSQSSEDIMTEKIVKIRSIIEHSRVSKAYIPDFDTEKFKSDFATVFVRLEEASNKMDSWEKEPDQIYAESADTQTNDSVTQEKKTQKNKTIDLAETIIPLAAIVASCAIALLGKKRGGGR